MTHWQAIAAANLNEGAARRRLGGGAARGTVTRVCVTESTLPAAAAATVTLGEADHHDGGRPPARAGLGVTHSALVRAAGWHRD